MTMEYYLGSDHASGIKTYNEDEFIQCVQEAIAEARERGQSVFELMICDSE